MSREPLRLLADGMLGRLAKWLRLLGYDTAYDNADDDLGLARRARAEKRVLLTRDRELAQRRGLRAILVRSQALAEQVRQVREELGPPPGPALSRCTLCNAALRPAAPTDVEGRVPPYVLETYPEFQRCPSCGRIYWPGSHVSSMRNQIDAFCGEGPADD
jgi:uncharacterized protein with PIN domain